MSDAKALNHSAPTGQQFRDGWLQTTPGERFKIRIRAEETQAAYTMLEMVADPRNGVPMHIHKNEDEHFIVLEGTLHIANGGQETGRASRHKRHRQQGRSSCLVQSVANSPPDAGHFFAWAHRRTA